MQWILISIRRERASPTRVQPPLNVLFHWCTYQTTQCWRLLREGMSKLKFPSSTDGNQNLLHRLVGFIIPNRRVWELVVYPSDVERVHHERSFFLKKKGNFQRESLLFLPPILLYARLVDYA